MNRRLHRALACLAVASPGFAQRELPPLPPPSAFHGDDELVAEKALRVYLAAPKERLDAQQLIAVFELGGEEGGRLRGERGARVAAVLRHHGLGQNALRRAAAGDGIEPGEHAWLALGADRETLLAWLADDALAADDAAVLAAAFALDDRFGDEPEVKARLVETLDHANEEVRRGLAEWIVHAWPELPEALVGCVTERAGARRAWLRAVAHKPRPDFGGTVVRWLATGDPPLRRDERLWAIATLPRAAVTKEIAIEVLRAHAADFGADGVDATWRAAANLPPETVDLLVGVFQRMVADGVEPTRLLPCLERVTRAGADHLLSLVATMPSDDAEALLSTVARRDRDFLEQRVRAALEGAVPLEPWMVRRVGPLLREASAPGEQGAERTDVVDRVAALVEGQDEQAELAWSALVGAKVYRPVLQRFAARAGRDSDDFLFRMARLAEFAGEQLDEDHLFELARNGSVQQAMAAYSVFAQQAQPARVRDLLVERSLEGRLETDAPAAMRALARSGSEADVRRVWASLRDGKRRDDPRRLATWIEIQAEAPKPWTHPLLLGELMARDDDRNAGERAAGAVDPDVEVGEAEVTAMLRLALARLGDRHLLEEIVGEALARSHWFAERAASFVVPRLQPAQLDRIGAAVLEREDLRDGRLAEELVEWLAAHPSHTSPTLERLWRESDDVAIADLALSGLLEGPRRDELVVRFTERVRHAPLEGEVRDRAYSLLGALPLPLGEADQKLVAWLMLVAPLHDPDRSLERGLHMRTGRVGFPFLSACMHAMVRSASEPDAALAAAADEARAHPNFVFASGVAWTNVLYLGATDAEVLAALRDTVGKLLLEIPDPDAPGVPLACWWEADRLVARGEFDAAIPFYERALRGLVRDASLWWTVRSVFGERDAGGGSLPMARLAAWPWICRFELARKAGDAAAARQALEMARRFAAGDDAAMDKVRRCAEELVK